MGGPALVVLWPRENCHTCPLSPSSVSVGRILYKQSREPACFGSSLIAADGQLAPQQFNTAFWALRST